MESEISYDDGRPGRPNNRGFGRPLARVRGGIGLRLNAHRHVWVAIGFAVSAGYLFVLLMYGAFDQDSEAGVAWLVDLFPLICIVGLVTAGGLEITRPDSSHPRLLSLCQASLLWPIVVVPGVIIAAALLPADAGISIPEENASLAPYAALALVPPLTMFPVAATVILKKRGTIANRRWAFALTFLSLFAFLFWSNISPFESGMRRSMVVLLVFAACAIVMYRVAKPHGLVAGRLTPPKNSPTFTRYP